MFGRFSAESDVQVALTRVQKNLAVAVVLLGLGGGAAAYTLKTKVKTPNERFKESQDAKRYYHFGRAHVKTGRLYSKSATFAFAREGTGWVITEPVQWPADLDAIDAMLNRMAGIVVDPLLTEAATEVELKNAGLDHPQTRLDVELIDGVKHTLFVGAKNKMVEKYPITTLEKKKIGLSDTAFHWSMARGFDEFRDLRVLPIDAKDVVGIQMFEGEDLHLGLTKKDGTWMVEGESLKAPTAADRGTVTILLVGLTKRLKVERFLDDSFDPKGPKAARYGLDKPSLRVVVNTKDGKTRTLSLAHYSQTGAEGSSMVAYMQGSTTLALLRAGTEKVFEASAAYYRDRTLSRFSMASVKKLRVEIAGEKPVTFTKKGDAWVIPGNKTTAAKVWKVDAIVRPFVSLKAVSWKTEAATKQERLEWLLKPWSRRVVVYGDKDAVLADIRIGNLADDDHLFAQAANDPRVALIPAKKLRAFPKHMKDLFRD